MKYWEVIADKLHPAGWSWGYCSAITPHGWLWIVDAHREGRRYIVQSCELLSAFLELEQTLCDRARFAESRCKKRTAFRSICTAVRQLIA